jgi:hypothetical protein
LTAARIAPDVDGRAVATTAGVEDGVADDADLPFECFPLEDFATDLVDADLRGAFMRRLAIKPGGGRRKEGGAEATSCA